MSYEAKVTRQGRTTIPKALRKEYKIKEGDTVIYIDLGDHLALLPISKNPLEALKALKIDVKGPIWKK